MRQRAHLRLVASSEPDDALAPPPVAPVRRDAANDPLPPDFGGFAPDGEAVRPVPAVGAGSRGIWAVALASATAHAALIAAFAMVLSPPGFEAQTDAVSVEIIVEAAPPAPDASAAAGAAGAPETIAAEDVAAERADSVPVETAEAVPPDMAVAVESETTEAVAADLTGPAEPAAAEAMEPVAKAEATEAPAEVATFVPPGPVPTLPETPPVAVDTPVETAIVPPGPAPVLPEAAPVFAADPAPPVLQAPPRDDAAAALLAPPPAFPPAEEVLTLPAAMATVPLPRPAPPEVAKAKPTPDAGPSKPAAKRKPAESETAKKPGAAKAAPPKPAKAAPTATEAKKKTAAKPSKASGAQGGGGSAAPAAAGPGVEAAYAKKLFAHLARRQRYPAAAERARVTGTVRLSIAIDRSGGLASARISKGSGSALLDKEALAAARRASPYPKPPDGVGGRTYGFAVTLRFDRKR